MHHIFSHFFRDLRELRVFFEEADIPLHANMIAIMHVTKEQIILIMKKVSAPLHRFKPYIKLQKTSIAYISKARATMYMIAQTRQTIDQAFTQHEYFSTCDIVATTGAGTDMFLSGSS